MQEQVLGAAGRDLGADGLQRSSANHVPLSPLGFIRRAAMIYPDRDAVVYGDRRASWAQTYRRTRRLASALASLGVGRGDTVAILAANTPELYEAHFGVPMAGAVLNALNYRLDPETVAYILHHSGAKVLFCDGEFSRDAKIALARLDRPPVVIDIVDPAAGEYPPIGAMDYEAFLAQGDEDIAWSGPQDEWDTITLNYTSGTTGRPKGVLYHHRGAYLNALGNIVEWSMGERPVYLWTLPMFHCNGWCFPWTIAAKAGTNVCLRKVEAKAIFEAIARERVDHLCGAPIVLKMMADADAATRTSFDHVCKIMTAASPPSASVLARIQERGFVVTHVYGLTETYGPAVVCSWHPEWDELSPAEQAERKSRQGFGYTVCDEVVVADPDTLEPVPQDGETMGEVLFRGNIVMKGYLKDEDATRAAFSGGWFRSGDLGVRHPDGYIQLKDRAKDIIISGGENISSIEVENVLQAHPSVHLAAVVARPDEHWGETPCAFVQLAAGADPVTPDELIAFCRARLAHYKCPKTVIFAALPMTSTGKIQKRVLREQASRL